MFQLQTLACFWKPRKPHKIASIAQNLYQPVVLRIGCNSDDPKDAEIARVMNQEQHQVLPWESRKERSEKNDQGEDDLSRKLIMKQMMIKNHRNNQETWLFWAESIEKNLDNDHRIMALIPCKLRQREEEGKKKGEDVSVIFLLISGWYPYIHQCVEASRRKKGREKKLGSYNNL